MVSMMIPWRIQHILNYIRDGINGAVFFLYLEDMVRIVDVNCGIWRADGVFYQAMLRANKLRYELLPYIYSTAGKVWLYDASMIRMLAFDFPKDAKVLEITDQYLFGESLMVCPVTENMYYKKSATGAEKQENPSKVRDVYLPEGCGWYDFGQIRIMRVVSGSRQRHRLSVYHCL